MNKQRGFTLIEMVVVIVILGIMAATALPRFTGMSADARASTVNGMLATVQSAAAIAHAQALAQNQTGATGSITMEGVAVALVNGYPSYAGIQNAVVTNAASFTYAAGPPATFSSPSAATAANCQVRYTEAAANGSPTIVANVSNCS